VVIVLFLGGIQLLSIGIIGEYLARMFDESKKRPLYFLKTGRGAAPFRLAAPMAPVVAAAVEQQGECAEG
jgi:hypothetical protein